MILKLDRLGYTIPIGEEERIANIVKIEVFDVDPETDPSAKPTELAALFPDHHEQITADRDEPLLGRPVYSVRTRGSGNLKLYPRCDQTYWFRVSFRPKIRRDPPPE